jgi:predicted DNA-binding transcriptional regulator AlpA
MRSRYDSSGILSLGPTANGSTHPSPAHVSYVTSFWAWRSLADSYGRLWILPPLPWHAGGVCTRLTLATLWMQEPTERCQRCRAECPGHRQIKSALRAWMRNWRITCGSDPRQLALSHGHRPTPASRLTEASRGRLFCAHHRGQHRPTNRTDLATNPVLPGSHHPEGQSLWTIGCAGWLGGLSRTTGAARRLAGSVMPGLDDVRDRRERDKLTIADVCADLGISRRTFYEWRAKGRAPRCITLPNGSLRIRRSEYQRWLSSREEAA